MAQQQTGSISFARESELDGAIDFFSITYRYSPGRPGTFYARNGDPGDPPEPAEVDWDLPEGLQLTDEEELDLYERIVEQESERDDDPDYVRDRREADRIDGFDRDDLGDSPDF
jgi:hypothetical protein